MFAFTPTSPAVNRPLSARKPFLSDRVPAPSVPCAAPAVSMGLRNTFRAKESFETRVNAAELAQSRDVEPSVANGEETLYRTINEDGDNVPSHIASFTKGLNHDENGQIVNPADFQAFVAATEDGSIKTIAALPLGPELGSDGNPMWESKVAQDANEGAGAEVRGWESMGAGLTFELQGPDAQSVSIPPAPVLTSPELAAEMAEVYLMALTRDLPIPSKDNEALFNFAINLLNGFSWFNTPAKVSDTPEEIRRRRGTVTIDNIFRGILPGSTKGDFLSQFIIAGSTQLGGRNGPNADDEGNGIIQYGSITIDQRVRIAKEAEDFLTRFDVFLDVQNAADLRGGETYETGKRLIATIRDLCTWVHFDALYEAYLNACLILLANGAPFDPSLPFVGPDSVDKQQGFATFGAAHILSLVTEVATRALKAVRYQKFNIHRRLRPEAVGGLIHANKTAKIAGTSPVFPEVDGLGDQLGPILRRVIDANEQNNARSGHPTTEPSFLLPMAYSEGSPMHPSYGSGHATVAGACVTILKAFFDADYVLPKTFSVDVVNDTLVESDNALGLTVGGELNKLADNVAIARNMAGVHYFTDAYESLLLGEKIAIGILEEQKLTFRENFRFNLTKFDGTSIRI